MTSEGGNLLPHRKIKYFTGLKWIKPRTICAYYQDSWLVNYKHLHSGQCYLPRRHS